jgi:hypothetical protein
MNMNLQRKDAKAQRREEARLSLTPGFSQVSAGGEVEKPFQRFLRAGGNPLKRFALYNTVNTRLKPGANEIIERNDAYEMKAIPKKATGMEISRSRATGAGALARRTKMKCVFG